MQLRISDGTTTVDLAGATTGIAGCTYFPLAGDGTNNVSESAEVIGSGTEAQIRAATTNIERLLDAARRRQKTQTGVRVFLEYKPVTGDSLYRSEIFDGRVVWSDEPGARRLKDTSPKVKFALMVTRAPWWEGPEAELLISANGQAADDGGRTITNDGAANWVQIASTQVAGTLPAPIRLRLTNGTGSSKSYRDFFVGVNAFGNPASFTHVLQGEDAVAGYGTDTASAGASGGYFNRLSVGTSGGYAIAWTLPAAMMAAGGRWFRLLLKSGSSIPAGLHVRPSIWDASGTTQLWIGQAQTLASGLYVYDLGAIPVPPGGWDSSYGGVRLLLYMQSASGTLTVDVDYMALLGMDAYRQLVYVSATVGNGDSIEVDEIEGKAYSIENAAKYPYIIMRGEPLMVWPGVTQQIVTVLMLSTGTSAITETLSVQVWYRPRRSTV